MRPRMRARRSASVCGRDAQEALVGVGRLLVALGARGDLPEVEMVVGLVGVDGGGAAQADEALREAVLVEVHHREPGDGHRLVALRSSSAVRNSSTERRKSPAPSSAAPSSACARADSGSAATTRAAWSKASRCLRCLSSARLRPSRAAASRLSFATSSR